MEFLALIILIISIMAGLAAIFFTTFGTLIIVLGCLIYAALTHFGILTAKHLLLLFTLYLCGEVLEYVFIKSLKAGSGGILGRAGSIIVKLLIAIVMLAIIGSILINHSVF